MSGVQRSTASLVADSQLGACFAVAARAGHTIADAEACVLGSVGCDACPFICPACAGGGFVAEGPRDVGCTACNDGRFDRG